MAIDISYPPLKNLIKFPQMSNAPVLTFSPYAVINISMRGHYLEPISKIKVNLITINDPYAKWIAITMIDSYYSFLLKLFWSYEIWYMNIATCMQKDVKLFFLNIFIYNASYA